MQSNAFHSKLEAGTIKKQDDVRIRNARSNVRSQAVERGYFGLLSKQLVIELGHLSRKAIGLELVQCVFARGGTHFGPL